MVYTDVMLSSRVLVAAFCLACAFSAQAVPITFFGENTNGDPFSRIAFPAALAARTMFLAQLPGASSTETLEALPAGTFAPLSLVFSGISTTTLTGGNSVVRSLTSGTDSFGEFPTSGSAYVAADGNTGLTITFSSPVVAFGFYGTDFGDFSGTSHLTVTFTGSGSPFTQTVNDTLGAGRNSPADGSVLFFGYIDVANSFTTVQILSPNDSFGFDDPVIGLARTSAVPEPGSVVLLAAGLIVLSSKIVKKYRV